MNTWSGARMLKTVLALAAYSVVLVAATWLARSHEHRSARLGHWLMRDEAGNPLDGWKVYKYDSGQPMLKELYDEGIGQVSRWYSPEGKLIRETVWDEGTAVGIYLRQDGSPWIFQSYVNGWAEGLTARIDEHGEITAILEFHKGKPVRVWPPDWSGVPDWRELPPIVGAPWAEGAEGTKQPAAQRDAQPPAQ